MMSNGYEAYYPFYGSIITVVAGGLFALWQSRPKAQTDRFSALVKAYSELNKEFRTDNERLRKDLISTQSALQTTLSENATLRRRNGELEQQNAELTEDAASLERLEQKIAILRKEEGVATAVRRDKKEGGT